MASLSASSRPAGSRLHFVEAGRRYLIWAVFVLAVGAYGTIRMVPPDGNPVGSDGFSYYVYLPSWVIYADPTLEDLADGRFGGSYPQWSGLTRWPGTGRWVNPHQMGVAVLLLPFYLAGHALTLLRHYPTDGFSYFYRHSAALGGAFYLAAGLCFLKRLLDRHARTGVVFATLIRAC